MVRHRRMLAPIMSIKHYIPTSIGQIASGSILNQKLVHGVVAPANTNTFDVIEGATVKAVYIEMWLVSNQGAGDESQFVLTVEKKRAVETDMSNSNALNLQAYSNKKNILYTTQGIVGSSSITGAVPVIRQYILIPKGKQRFGLDDELFVNVAAVGLLQRCGIATYKEYR